jgi:tape measure domain-containing protein
VRSIITPISSKLNLNIGNFVSNLRKAAAQANKFASNLSGQINAGLVEPAKKAKFEFKDVARIVQGIMISKVFYGGLSAIRAATNAVWEFGKQLEYAKIVYSNLFGSTELATEFINVLKDFAAVTPFAFSDAEEAAKRLLAYGIQYKNVMYVMQGVLAASTVQNNPAVIESISRAIGQIYTKGRLMNEEMRQLAEAGIPAYEILREKLGLTNDQLRNLGKTAIPASVAINALIDGINERFGGVVEQAAKTTQGIISNIKDNAVQLFAGIFSPAQERIRLFLADIEKLVSRLRQIYELKGLGGVFEALVPPELQAAVRTLIVNLMNLWSVIKSLVSSVFNILGSLMQVLLPVLNAVLPILNAIAGYIAGLINLITSNEKVMRRLISIILAAAAAWLIYKTYTLAATVTTAVANLIIKSVKGIITAFNFLLAHPIWALLAVGVGLFIYLSGASNKFAQSIRNVFAALTSLGGVDPSKILLPESKERANDLSKFNEKLEATAADMEDLASSTGKANKAAKGLFSFDEVFSLKAPDESIADNITDTLDDMSDALAGFEVPDMALDNIWDGLDFGGAAQDFVDNLLEALGGKSQALNMGIGGLLGAIIGGLIGGPLGAAIGGLAGAILGYFWDDIAKALNLTDTGKVAIPLATFLGAAIGAVFGGPMGALIGGAIGALVGWIIDAIARMVETGDWTPLAMPLGIGLGAAIGLVAGGPVGALIGAAIGGLVGWLVKLIADNWGPISEWFAKTWQDISKWLEDTWRKFGIWLATKWLAINDWYNSKREAFLKWLDDIALRLGKWWSGITDTVKQWLSKIGITTNSGLKPIDDSYTKWRNGVRDDFLKWWNNIWNMFAEWLAKLALKVSTGLATMKESFLKWAGEVGSSASTTWAKIWDTFTTWIDKLKVSVQNGLNIMGKAFANWADDIWNNTFVKLFEWIAEAIKKLEEFFNLNSQTSNYGAGYGVLDGHATGGIFDKEHIARFAEGNKAEAVIPLENASAMQPFVDAIARGITNSLAPIILSSGNQGGSQQVLYVGTLIADDRGIKELNKRLEILQVQERDRKGL